MQMVICEYAIPQIMKVSLIDCTPNATVLCDASARVCYSEDGLESIYNRESAKGVNNSYSALKRAVKSGHWSVLEHATYTFSIEGISRACSHQLVRHRMASYSQQSQRYVNMSEAGYVIPDSIARSCSYAFDDMISVLFNFYKDMVAHGIPEEDARYILPNACATNIVVTMNARELLHFFKLRCCNRAQWEIREVACEMLKLVREKDPLIFGKAGPSCATGKCTEDKPCGRPWNGTDLL